MKDVPREWKSGQNLIRFEPPDLIRVKYRGPCALNEAIEMVDISREVGSVRPFFLLGDMEEAGAMSAEARLYFTAHFRTEWMLGMIAYKARLLHRALITGLRLALELAREDEKQPLLGKLHFVSTLEQAEALLAQLRARHP